jgi:hypothetical protein
LSVAAISIHIRVMQRNLQKLPEHVSQRMNTRLKKL